MEIIEKWFNDGCIYALGVLIYKNLPKHNAALLKTFERKENSFNLEKLKYELKKFIVAGNQEKIISEIKIAINKNPKPVENLDSKKETKTAVLFHQLPEVLRPVLLEANQLFKENCMLKVSLNDLPQHAEKEALELQKKIYSNIKKNALCWKRIDYFQKHRVVAETPKSEYEGFTPAALYRSQQLLYASISKLKTRLNANRGKLIIIENVKSRSLIERQIIKQEDNLIQQNEKLITITNLIDG